MNIQSIGIVLRDYAPQKAQMALLDQALGRIDVRRVHERTRIFFEKLSAGTVISYTLIERGQFFSVHVHELIESPLELAKKNILFLHHILEICYFFMPAGGNRGDDAVFNVVRFLYGCGDYPWSSAMQKVFVFRLYAMLGMYPESKRFHTSLFYYWASCPIVLLWGQKIDREHELLLDMWLINCVKVHPMVSSFKTVRFLDEARIS